MKNKIIKIGCFGILLLTLITSLSVSALATWTGSGTYKFATYVPQVEEMRAVWVATVSNIDMPRMKGTSEAAQTEWKNYYLNILDTAEKQNLNTIIFQIRPCNDAFYPSEYNPWSEFLVGYGEDPGFDPLAWMLEVTHGRGMEFHAWLNPYRTSVGTLTMDISTKDSSTGIAKAVDYDESELNTYKDAYFADLKGQTSKDYKNPIFATGSTLHTNVVLGMEDKFVLNPASTTVQEHLNNTIREIVENYDVDGIHFDDYFYPDDCSYGGSISTYKGYTFSTEPYQDMKDYQNYVQNGGTLSIYNWRRDNIDTLIYNLSVIIREINQTKTRPCAFGISPCARWAPQEYCTAFERGAEGGMDGSCNNYYAYSDLYANTRKWALEEWIDYIVPQCYMNLDDGYGLIVEWWSNTLKNSKTKLYIGQGVYMCSSWNSAVEMNYQVRFNQTEKYNVAGYFFYNYKSIIQGKGSNAMNALSQGIWRRNSLTPTYEGYHYSSTVSGKPTITSIVEESSEALTINFTGVSDAKAYIIKSFNENETIDVNSGTYEQIVFSGHNSVKLNRANIVETKTYIIAPVAYNNEISTQYEVIDFSKIVVNEVPQISMVDFPKTVNTGETNTFKVAIIDGDSNSFSYTIYLSEDGENFNRQVAKGNIDGYEFSFIWKSYYSPQEGLSFKITVSDGKDQSELVTDKFDIIKEVIVIKSSISYELDGGTLSDGAPSEYIEGTGLNVLPTATKEGYNFVGWELNGSIVSTISASEQGNIVLVAKWEKISQPKKGCKKSAELFVESIAIISLSIMIIRRKREN